MDRSTLRRHAFKYLLALSFVTTAGFTAFVFHARPTVESSAIQPKTTFAVTDESTRPFVLTIPCWENLDAVPAPPAGTRWLRITGNVCGEKLGVDQVSITNETNHYQATIFPAGNQLTTDLIGLAPGANDVQIVIAGRQGREVKHLALRR